MEVVDISSDAKTQTSTNIYELLRIARKVKVKDLAEQLRVTPGYIHAIESGAKSPSTRLIKDYADFFDVDENVILNFDKDSGTNTFEKLLLKLLTIICK